MTKISFVMVVGAGILHVGCARDEKLIPMISGAEAGSLEKVSTDQF